MLRSGYGVSAGRVHDHDAALCGGIDIDIVDTHAGAPDRLQFLGDSDDIGADLRLASDNEGGILGDNLEQFLVGQPRLESHIEASPLGKRVDSALGNRVGYKNFGFRHGKTILSGGRAARHAHNGSVW